MDASIEERQKLELFIIMESNYNISFRKIKKELEKYDINVSHVTIKSDINKLLIQNPIKYEKIIEMLGENKPQTVKDESVRNRVLLVAKYIKSGFTIEEISESIKIPYWTLYRDIKNRLIKINQDLYQEVEQILTEHKMNNLRKKD